MAPHVVVDSGILIASVFQETVTSNSKAILSLWTDQAAILAAPRLFQYEVVAVARKAVFQNRVTAEEGLAARDFMLSFQIDLYLDNALLKRAYDLATELDRPTAYDSQYLALAERLGCEFWTADERLYNAVHEKLAWVKWVGHFEANEQ